MFGSRVFNTYRVDYSHNSNILTAGNSYRNLRDIIHRKSYDGKWAYYTGLPDQSCFSTNAILCGHAHVNIPILFKNVQNRHPVCSSSVRK
jgi:hypothetical protein